MNLLMDSQVHLMEKEQQLVGLVTSIFQLGCQPQAKMATPANDIKFVKKLLGENLREDLILHSLAQIV